CIASALSNYLENLSFMLAIFEIE
ncbi:hypothetical protein Q522_02678, partial [Staphylococcus aureus M1354]